MSAYNNYTDYFYFKPTILTSLIIGFFKNYHYIVSMLKSYYEILNIKSTSTKDEIKKQYKKLVKMYHPDINSSFEAEKLFKEINKAAEILLDDEKRKNYDNLRKIYKKNNSTKEERSSSYSFSDLFKNENKKYKKEIKSPINGDDITISITIDYKEALLGTYRIINIANSTICPKCKGHKFANNQKCQYCKGKGEITINKKITVKIPPSIKNKNKLRIKEEGKAGKYGGKNGNLYIVVNIEKNNDLIIENNTVYYNAEISPYMAILGGDVKVPTLWGEAIIKIPPLTKTNQSFKLIDVGVLNEKTNKKGDEIVKIIIQIPNKITSEEHQLYEKLKQINLNKNHARTI